MKHTSLLLLALVFLHQQQPSDGVTGSTASIGEELMENKPSAVATETAAATTTKISSTLHFDESMSRDLQAATIDDLSTCYKTESATNNKYCTVRNTPRNDTFLMLACPNFNGNYNDCDCTIGLGDNPSPNTETCSKCGFCSSGALAYDCRNLADGSCAAVNCRGECISSTDVTTEVEIKPLNNDKKDDIGGKSTTSDGTGTSGATQMNDNVALSVGVPLTILLVKWMFMF